MNQQATAVVSSIGSSSAVALGSTEWAAKYLDVSETFLNQDRLTRRHGIPFVRVGRSIKYRQADLDAWIAAHREDTAAA